MKKTIVKQFDDIMENAYKLEDSEEKLQLFDQAIALASEHDLYYLEFLARLESTKTCKAIENQNDLFKYFLWCINFVDDNEERLQEEMIYFLWEFKHFLETIIKFPTFTLDEVDFFFEFFRQQCEKYNYSLRTYHKLKCMHYRINGIKGAEDEFELWQKSKFDDLSDCEVCEIDEKIMYLFDVGKDKEAFKLASELLKSEWTCKEVPKITYSKLIMPFYKSRNIEKAAEMQEKGYFQIYQNNRYLLEIADHILFFALTNPRKGIHIFNRHFPFAYSGKYPYGQYKFFLVGWMLAEACAKQNIPIKTPIGFLKETTFFIANYFDERNNNQKFKDEIEKTFSLLNSQKTIVKVFNQ